MGCDANELLDITSDLLYGKNSNIPELKELGLHFKKLIEDDYDRFYYIEPYLDTLQDPEARKLGDSNYKFIMSYR